MKFLKMHTQIRKKKKLLWLLLLVPVLAIILIINQMANFFQPGTPGSTVNEEIIAKTAEKGSIQTVLSTAGSISDTDSASVHVAEKVTITSLEVSNGDTVTAGDVLAHVDKSSALLAILDIQNMLEELDTELEEAKEETIESTIKATAKGRIKAIYADAGESVLTAMYDHSALILISLDGKMAVEIETTSELSVGDIVDVKTSDGSTYSGKVTEKKTSSAVVTVSDEDTIYGDTVTVTDKDGNELGSGTLRINSEQKVTGYSGTVKNVKVSVDQSVSPDDTLLTLEDTTYTAVYHALLNQRHTLEEQMQELFGMYQTGTITAKHDGIVTDLNKDLAKTPTTSKTTAQVSQMSSRSTTDYVVSDMSYTTTAGTFTSGLYYNGDIMLMAANGSPVDTEEEVYDFSGRVVSVSDGQLVLKISSEPISLDDYRDLSGVNTDSLEQTVTLSVPSSVGIYQYNNDTWNIRSLSELKTDQTIICSFDTQGNLLWIIVGPEPTGGDTSGEDSSGDNPPEDNPSDDHTPGNDSSGGDTPGNESAGSTPSGDAANGNPSDSNAAENNGNIPGSGSIPNGGNMPSGGNMANGGSMPSGGNITGGGNMAGGGMNLSGLGGVSGDLTAGQPSSTSSEEEEAAQKAASRYTISENTLCTVTPQDQATIKITVDELDINSLSLGDEAQITLDALSGQRFTGTVSKINTTGTNSGGNAKYTVEVTIERNEHMLTGMNAAVNFVQKVTDDVVTIPAAALSESAGHVYVYTSYNEKEDSLEHPVEVTTGVSDGENVEILDGLSEGDTYYYRYADSITWSFLK